ncbi:EAL domain-containing protein [Thermosipho ferrireducens]|uniref:EAL domain-containing protein n=1 Tax=Thermosipho ferrireducens TaxID=2571116 RepID=A0ABX7S706_9BACT|nr:EAL domain-containing protein [Thermosipho ferrireducens]QTA37688.1 EAL domain-containing protein [Thermosipho ferrireducens]
MFDFLYEYVEDIDLVSILKEKRYGFKKPVLLLVVKFPVKNENFDNVFERNMKNKLTAEFESILSNFFKPIFTTITPYYEFISVCEISGKYGNRYRFEKKIEDFENVILNYFIENVIVKISENNLKSFPEIVSLYLDFAVGYSFITSWNNIYLALDVAIERAKIRAKSKVIKLSDRFLDLFLKQEFDICWRPVIDIKKKKIKACEPLIVGSKGTGLEMPEVLQKIAVVNNFTENLNTLFFKKIFEEFVKLEKSVKIIINITMYSEDYLKELNDIFEEYNIPFERVILSFSAKDQDRLDFRIMEMLIDKNFYLMLNVNNFELSLNIFKMFLHEKNVFVRIEQNITFDLHFNVKKQDFIKKITNCFPNVIIQGRDEKTFEIASKVGCKYYQSSCGCFENYQLFLDEDIIKKL